MSIFRHPFGRSLRRDELAHQVLAKKFALPIFASDALSSVAYATEEILKVLALAGAAYFGRSLGISLVVMGMLAILLLSYRQTIFAYPNGGGAYIVARDNLGERVAQVAGAALLVDYVLTVSVSLAAGVANFASGLHQFVPSIPDFNPIARVTVSLIVLFVMWYGNKRGIRESGRAFAFPTYFFLASVFLMLIVGLAEYVFGSLDKVQDVAGVIQPNRSLTLFLLLRAFASGSTATTGIEAISNGITAFEEPKSRNAATTMIWMVGLLGAMFFGITELAIRTHAQASMSETVISQLGRTVFGAHSPLYVAVIFGTAAVLVMAANTSFADFPRLAALHAGDGFLPHWMTDRDNRLVYGLGITVLSLASGTLIAIFQADVSRLIPLYAIGVFLSFSISQTGMVVRWLRTARLRPGERRPSYSPEGVLVTTLEHDRHWRWKMAINGLGATVTAVVVVVFAVAKFTEGAWITAVLVPAMVFVFFRIHHHYKSVEEKLDLDQVDVEAFLAEPDKRIRILFLSSLDKSSLPAIRDMLATFGPSLKRHAVHVDINPQHTQVLRKRWVDLGLDASGLPLVTLTSGYGGGNVVGDLVDYVHQILSENPSVQVEVFIPEWSEPETWWQWPLIHLLHHMTATRLKLAFLHQGRVTVTNRRYILGS
ncbi:MAG TPA: APC family permease [Nitrospira sp.]|nr:APC family permease [Nitrospira sp.]